MLQQLNRQLSIDYCCSEAEAADAHNHFTLFQPRDGSRQFEPSQDGCFLKIAVYRGKLLVTGREDIVSCLAPKLGHFPGAWFMDAGSLTRLRELIAPYGYCLKQAHLFFTDDRQTPVDTSELTLKWYTQEEIAQFSDDNRYDEAFAFCDTAPDVLGVAALHAGEILSIAGASADSPTMWQLGINTVSAYAGRGLATRLITLLKNEVLRRGRLPFYGTAMSHIASQRVALGAQLQPAWAELFTEKTDK